MWEYATFSTSRLSDIAARLNWEYDRDWELVTISESREAVCPESPDYRFRMWWSTFDVLLKRKKTDELA